jgi:hypothetical protein
LKIISTSENKSPLVDRILFKDFDEIFVGFSNGYVIRTKYLEQTD